MSSRQLQHTQLKILLNRKQTHRMSRTFIKRIMGFADLFTADVKFSFNGQPYFHTVLGSVLGILLLICSILVSLQFYYSDRLMLTKQTDDRPFSFTNQLGFTIHSRKCKNWEVRATCTTNSVMNSKSRIMQVDRNCGQYGEYCVTDVCGIRNRREVQFSYLEIWVFNLNASACGFKNESIFLTLHTETSYPDLSNRNFKNVTKTYELQLSNKVEQIQLIANHMDFSVSSFLSTEVGIAPSVLTSISVNPPIRNSGMQQARSDDNPNLLSLTVSTSNQVSHFSIQFPPILQLLFIAVVVYQVSSGLLNMLFMHRYARNLMYLRLSQCSQEEVDVRETNWEVVLFCLGYVQGWERIFARRFKKYIQLVQQGKAKLNVENFIQRIANLSQLCPGRQVVSKCRISEDNSGLICEQDKQFLTSLQAIGRQQRQIYQLYPPQLMIEAATRS